MVAYRGIEKEEVIQSIRDAAAFVDSLNVGPETQKSIQPWLEETNYQKLEAAQTDKDFAKAVRETGVNGTFIFLYNLLDFHAATNTEGKGRKVFDRLAEWGAIDGARHMVLTAQDQEIDAHIKQKSRNPVFAVKKLAHNFRKAVSQDYGRGASSPFGRYGVVMENLDWNDRTRIDPVLQDVQKILSPYHETDEVQMTGIGMITDSFNDKANKKSGIMFVSTRRVAQAVADAHPEYEVCDYKGNKLEPKKPSGPTL